MTEEKELRDIKKLLILLLQANKVDQSNIAEALGVSQPAVSLMLTRRRKKRGEKNAKEEGN